MGTQKHPAEGLKDPECEWGAITNRPPIPYVAPVDPYNKQKKTKIKVKLPDGTNYQMAPFCAGSNKKEYLNHIIAMIQLIQQKELKSSMEKAFVVASDIKDKIGPLHKKLNMSKSRGKKEVLTQQIKTAEKERKKVKKAALAEILKAYELFCVYFVGKARTRGTR